MECWHLSGAGNDFMVIDARGKTIDFEALSKEQLEAALKAFITLYREIRYTLSPRFEIELLISRLSSLSYLASPDTLIKKLENMRSGIAEGHIVLKKKPQLTVIESIKTEKKEETVTISEPVEEPVASIPSCYIEEEEASPQSSLVDKTIIPRLEEELRSQNSLDVARCLQSIEDIIDDGSNHLIFQINKNITFRKFENYTKDVEKALLEITGNRYKVICKLNLPVTNERVASKKMQALKDLLDGNIVFREETKTEIEEKKEENKNVQLQSVRSDEENGYDRSPDEDD